MAALFATPRAAYCGKPGTESGWKFHNRLEAGRWGAAAVFGEVLKWPYERGLEIRWGRKPHEGSNPSLSANKQPRLKKAGFFIG